MGKFAGLARWEIDALERRERNVILSYPRSGISWLKRRLNLFLEMRFDRVHAHGASGRYTKHMHLGYLPHQSPRGFVFKKENRKIDFEGGARIIVLLREPCATLASIYHYRVNKRQIKDGRSFSAFVH